MARPFAKQFYNSKEWEKMRTYILIRDRYRCNRCGRSDDTLEVHHIIHLTPDNINDASITLNDKNLTTLCRDCHFLTHEDDKLRGSKQHSADAKHDCDAEYEFDADGFLVLKNNLG